MKEIEKEWCHFQLDHVYPKPEASCANTVQRRKKFFSVDRWITLSIPLPNVALCNSPLM